MSIAPGVLVLAGLDPSGGAGLLADAEAVRAAGGRPLCVATALTVQSNRRARSFRVVEPALVCAQAFALLDDEEIAAVKVGMIGNAAGAAAVVEIAARAGVPLIVDPVLAASSGASLFEGTLGQARAAYAPLLVRAALVTPNLSEAQALLELPAAPNGPDSMEAAGRALVAQGAQAALVKGGHLGGDPLDVLVSAAGVQRWTAPRLPGGRGTGCRLASAIAAGLARGLPLAAAVEGGRAFVRAVLARQ